MTRLTRNVIYNTAGQAAILVISVVAVRYIFRRLGDDAFGIIVFNLVLTTVLSSALELGISATIVRQISSHFEAEREYVRDLVRTASLLYWGFGGALFALILLAAPFLVTHWVNLKSMDAGTATTMLRILSVTSLVTLPKVLYASVFRGRQLMELNNAIDVGTALVQQAGIVVLLLRGAGVYPVAIWISGSAALGIVAYVLVASRIAGWSALVPGLSSAVIRRNLGFTGHMMAISALSLVQSQAPQVIVSKLLPIVQFGYYGFIASTVNRATLAANAVAQAAFPSLSNLFAAGDRPALHGQYTKLQDLVCYGTLPLFTGITFAALPVYGFVFNASAAQELLLPTAFLALGTWMNATVSVPYMLMVAIGKPEVMSRLNLYATLFVLPITVVLIAAFGISGAAFSWVVYHLFVYAYFVPRVSQQGLERPSLEWYLHVARVLALGAVTFGAAWMVLAITGTFSLFAVVAAYVLASGAFAAAAYLMIGPDLRATIRRLPRNLPLLRERAT
jgi:O-antigen/teichoic acid export membrane protein